MAHRSLRIVLPVLVVASVLMLSPGDASAHPFGIWKAATELHSVSDSSIQTYCFANIPSSEQQGYVDSMSYLDGAVDMSVAGGGCDSTIDSLFLRNDSLTDGTQTVRGVALCANSLSSAVCDSFWIGINYTEISANSAARGGDGWNVVVNLIKTIRHEIGHSVGLAHDTTLSAMVSGWVATSLGYTTYTTHDVDHINHAHEPGGVLDNVIATATGFRAQGWTIDPDAVQPFWSFVRIVVDATPTTADANGYRPDVQSVYPQGPYHGFDVAVLSGPGSHYVCAYGVNSGTAGPGTNDVLLGCRWATR